MSHLEQFLKTRTHFQAELSSPETTIKNLIQMVPVPPPTAARYKKTKEKDFLDDGKTLYPPHSRKLKHYGSRPTSTTSSSTRSSSYSAVNTSRPSSSSRPSTTSSSRCSLLSSSASATSKISTVSTQAQYQQELELLKGKSYHQRVNSAYTGKAKRFLPAMLRAGATGAGAFEEIDAMLQESMEAHSKPSSSSYQKNYHYQNNEKEHQQQQEQHQQEHENTNVLSARAVDAAFGDYLSMQPPQDLEAKIPLSHHHLKQAFVSASPLSPLSRGTHFFPHQQEPVPVFTTEINPREFHASERMKRLELIKKKNADIRFQLPQSIEDAAKRAYWIGKKALRAEEIEREKQEELEELKRVIRKRKEDRLKREAKLRRMLSQS